MKPRCEPWALGWCTPGAGAWGQGRQALRLYGDLGISRVATRKKFCVVDNLKNISLVVSFYILLLETFVVVLLFGAYKFSVYLRKRVVFTSLCAV